MHDQLLKLSCRQGKITDVKSEKSQLVVHFEFFLAIVELFISNMHKKILAGYMKNIKYKRKIIGINFYHAVR